jgi:hypothetical protein
LVSLSSVFFDVPLCLAALGDVLHTGSGGLDHLVVRAAAAVDVAVAEPHRDIVDKLGDLEALEPAIAAVLWDQRFSLAVAAGLARPGRAIASIASMLSIDVHGVHRK